MKQQLKEEHPFTHAMPGGWAWTDHSGGVPDADDTSGALLALWTLAGASGIDAAAAGIRWLLDLQNSDGGIPTFCKGWGALPFDRSAPDLTAHALEAWSVWHDTADNSLQTRMAGAAAKAVSYLLRCQHKDGSWTPLWFGNQHTPDERNLTYGTSRVVSALGTSLVSTLPGVKQARRRGLDWLLQAQSTNGGWGGGTRTVPSIEETALALIALAGLSEAGHLESNAWSAIERGTRFLIEVTEEGNQIPAAPIGLYFARLWYYEDLYPLVFALRGLTRVSRMPRQRSGALYAI
jgi:squalene-hopene/tetraprenyl-beta-curcumene cyclase